MPGRTLLTKPCPQPNQVGAPKGRAEPLLLSDNYIMRPGRELGARKGKVKETENPGLLGTEGVCVCVTIGYYLAVLNYLAVSQVSCWMGSCQWRFCLAEALIDWRVVGCKAPSSSVFFGHFLSQIHLCCEIRYY